MAFQQNFRRNQRGLQVQVRLIKEREVNLSESRGLATARQWRDRLAGRVLGDTVQDVHLGRSSRRLG